MNGQPELFPIGDRLGDRAKPHSMKKSLAVRQSNPFARTVYGSVRGAVSILSMAGILLGFVGNGDARVCGRLEVERYRAQNVAAAKTTVEQLQVDEEIKVGTQLNFDVFNRLSLMSATCRYVGERAYVFVEDGMWDDDGGPLVTGDVEGLVELFDTATPADPGRGIFQLGAEAFGVPFDADGEERIFIVVLDIGANNILGFFDRGVSTHQDPALRRDAVYLDANEVWLRKQRAAGTLAHEFQHLIHWGFDPDEEVWINEGLSGYAEELAGFPEIDTSVVPAYLQNPSINLTAWFNEAYSYGSTYLFASYLAETYGNALIRNLVEQPRNGRFGIDDAFEAEGLGLDFKQIWGEWIAATYVGDAEVGYAATRGRRPEVSTPPDVPFENWLGIVGAQWGSTNLLLLPEGPIALDFNAQQPGKFTAWVYSVSRQGTQLQRIPLEDDEDGTIEVAAADSVVLIVGRSSAQGGIFALSARVLEVPTAVSGEAGPSPDGHLLLSAYPNPFNSQAAIPFVLARPANVDLSVYDVLGQPVRQLFGGRVAAGAHELRWDGRNDAGERVSTGVYTVVLRSRAGRVSRRVSLLR